MSENGRKDSFLSKIGQTLETAMDNYLAKAKAGSKEAEAAWDRRGLIDLAYETERQNGWVEKRGMIGPDILKSMARKDSIIVAIRKTRIAQASRFSKPQKDKYSPGWVIKPVKPADLPEEDKLKLSDPTLNDDLEAKAQLQADLDKKRLKLFKKQEQEIELIKNFILNCGNEEDSFSFNDFMSLIIDDRLTYNYSAIELIPTMDRESIAKFFPVSANGIRYVAKASADRYKQTIKEQLIKEGKNLVDDDEPLKYLQIVRGRVVAAWTDSQLIFEPGMPTVDPEDQGYAQGELEQIIQIITAHLYAEAHNRNFFTQGLGTKGILHIKGDNVSRAQLEAFRRVWTNQIVNTRNAFRPPIIGIADEVRWVELSQSNKDMEFDNWMNYLIRISTAVFQMDPAEINFDISKVKASTLNEASSDSRMRASKDKGLNTLLDYVENIINDKILKRWNSDLASRYKFTFVGLDAETRKEEIERLKSEVGVWKTVNEARIEMGRHPIEDGDIILAATYTQYKAQKDQIRRPEEAPGEQTSEDGEDAYLTEFNRAIEEAGTKKEPEKEEIKKEEPAKEAEDTKKSITVIEYYENKDD